MNFLEQLKLQALRRFEEENKLYNAELDDHIVALEAVVANSPDGVLITEAMGLDGRDPRVQYLNPAFTTITGYSAHELIGKVLQVIFGSFNDTVLLGQIQKSLLETNAAFVETPCRKKDGATFWAEIRVSLVVDRRGKPSKWTFAFRDVSERKSAKELASRLSVLETDNERLLAEVKERKALEANLTYNAFHDTLTGLKNRAYFLDRVGEALERSRSRSTYRGAVLYLDLDGFKAVNDKMGHRGGDRVLIEVSRRIELCCRPQDTICRLGGDEFAILIDNIAAMESSAVAQRILDRISEPYDLVDATVTVTPSLGLCEVDPIYQNVDEIIRDADTAMYRAKRQGGARYVSFDDGLNQSIQATHEATRQLEQAIQRRDFEVYYQPLLDILTTPPRLWAVEALVRWNHPERGLLAPEDFMPLAEKTGLIVPLGMLVIRAACLRMKYWQSDVLHPDFMLSVNLSVGQLNHPNFFADLVDVLADTAFDARSLQIEVSEQTLTQNAERFENVLKRLRQLGIQIVLKNFGTGSASIVQLEQSPIDILKLDRSVVARLVKHNGKTDTTKMIIELALALGIKVVAQGVENEVQSATLLQYGCTLVQGNFYSAPVPEDKITAMLDHGADAISTDGVRA